MQGSHAFQLPLVCWNGLAAGKYVRTHGCERRLEPLTGQDFYHAIAIGTFRRITRDDRFVAFEVFQDEAYQLMEGSHTN